ncbi:hypothetical protein [Nonomuraea sp. SYSU D8015]|uniref:hypothetical protein n=1 Tax=Nonomuraea sp. SYSU D8015 TaxID=2593644 RepID=UPI0016614EBA|nr:hypothetical protein [Nonomuraea sp. SYSU D8015]
MHWHAYQWIGAGEDRGKEAERRPGSPDFATSALPPMRTGDWLVKPASRMAATFAEVEGAVEWLAAEYGEVRGTLLLPERILPEDYARDALSHGVDCSGANGSRAAGSSPSA